MVTINLNHLDGRPWKSLGFSDLSSWGAIAESVAESVECDPDEVGCTEDDDGVELVTVRGAPIATISKRYPEGETIMSHNMTMKPARDLGLARRALAEATYIGFQFAPDVLRLLAEARFDARDYPDLARKTLVDARRHADKITRAIDDAIAALDGAPPPVTPVEAPLVPAMAAE